MYLSCSIFVNFKTYGRKIRLDLPKVAQASSLCIEKTGETPVPNYESNRILRPQLKTGSDYPANLFPAKNDGSRFRAFRSSSPVKRCT
jgi:hypothetical protein